MFIYCDTIEQLTEIVAGLVKQGLTFSAQMQQHSAGWKITLTGGVLMDRRRTPSTACHLTPSRRCLPSHHPTRST